MTDYAAQGVGGSQTSTALTLRTGTASADRVPAGARLVARNAGAGTHTLTFVSTQTYSGRAVANQTATIAAGGATDVTVDSTLDGDGDGYVSLNIDGTATEVTYYVLGR